MKKHKGVSLLETLVSLGLLGILVGFTSLTYGVSMKMIAKGEIGSNNESIVYSNMEIYLNDVNSIKSEELKNEGKIISYGLENLEINIEGRTVGKIQGEKIESRNKDKVINYYIID